MILDILKDRQNARIVIVCPDESRLVSIEQWLISNLPARYVNSFANPLDEGSADKQIIVGTLMDVRRSLRRLGPCDWLILDDCYNLAPIGSSRKFKEIESYWRDKNLALSLVVYPPAPILNLPQLKPSGKESGLWRCGETPVTINLPDAIESEPIRIRPDQENSGPPCGAMNKGNQFFCRSCGRFRGGQFLRSSK